MHFPLSPSPVPSLPLLLHTPMYIVWQTVNVTMLARMQLSEQAGEETVDP